MASPTDIRPPFTAETASAKVRAAEDAWNSRDPKRATATVSATAPTIASYSILISLIASRTVLVTYAT